MSDNQEKRIWKAGEIQPAAPAHAAKNQRPRKRHPVRGFFAVLGSLLALLLIAFLARPPSSASAPRRRRGTSL